MSFFLILALLATALNIIIGFAVFFGGRGFKVDLRRGPRRSDNRRGGGRREQDVLAAR